MTARFAGVIGLSSAEIVHTVSSNAQNLSAYSLFGSPSAAGTYRLIIATGVTVGSDGTTSAQALHTGNTGGGAFQWHNAAALIIENRGKILGIGGAGNSFNGGNALAVGMPNVSINNGAGLIGGGGGGGAQGASDTSAAPFAGGGGGGGGGGQGSNGGAAGSGVAWGTTGSDGTAGTPTAPGLGGAGGPAVGPTTLPGEDGGNGGTLGAAGSPNSGYSASGGNPGKAVALNGFTVAWISGNDSSRVKGPVS